MRFDKNFDLLWQEGFVIRYDGIYLITSLLYLKRLEDIESVDVGVLKKNYGYDKYFSKYSGLQAGV